MKSIMQQDLKCYICQLAVATEEHHIFGASNRRHSEEDGLKVRLCRRCHEHLHFGKNGQKTLKALQQAGQSKFDETRSREEFMERYGRSWL